MTKRIPWLLGLILVVLAVWLQITSNPYVRNFIQPLENLAYDIQLRTKVFTGKPLTDSVIGIVDIDDKSLAAEGRWPWSRSKLKSLVDRLREAGVVVIAFDLIFPEKEANIAAVVAETLTQQKIDTPQVNTVLKKIEPFFNNDAQFAESLKQSDTILGITLIPRPVVTNGIPKPLFTLNTPGEQSLGLISAPGILNNLPIFAENAKSSAFINVFADQDGIIRHVPVLLRYQNNVYPSLALEAVRLYLLGNIKMLTATYGDSIRLEGIQLGAHTIPTKENGEAIIPFKGKSFTFPYFSATDVLNKKIPSQKLEGKIIFIGTSATGEGDLQTTAIQSGYPGVEIHATVADAILKNTFSYKPAWTLGAELFLTVFLGLICAFSFPYFGPRILSILIIILPIVFIFANNFLWSETGLIISILIPTLLIILLGLLNIVYGYLFETLRRERLKEMFGQYVPAKHIDDMLSSSGNYGLLGQDREMTVLFADIRNFTTISEPLSATQLKDLLNEFFTPMTEIIFKHTGTIDKYVGDLIMAFWGAPLKDKKHAQHALAAAIEMQTKVKKLQEEFSKRNLPEINIGIGLNSGIMSVEDMGSKFRRNYTVLGDAVNLASRVESLTKFYGVGIMTTEFTEKNQTDFIFRQLDRVKVKGKQTAISIYEVIGKRKNAPMELLDEIQASNSALNFYFNQEWVEAKKHFSELHLMHPNTKFYSLYLERIEAFEKNPPGADWDGVYIHLSK